MLSATYQALVRARITPEELKKAVVEALKSMGPNNAFNELLTTKQAAKSLCLHPDTVRKYCREARIRCIKLGRVYRIRYIDLLEFMEMKEEA